MPEIIEITELDSPELAPYARLTDAQLHARGALVAEGTKVIAAALDAGAKCLSLLMEKKHISGKARNVIARAGAPVYAADAETLEKLTGYRVTRGVLGCFERPPEKRAEDVLKDARTVVVLDRLNDAENVGAIFRTATALGADALLLTETCRDALSRRTLRVSMGTALRLPWARIPCLENGGAEILRGAGFESIALTLKKGALSVDAPELKAIKKKALVLGAEGDGLSDAAIAACDRCAVIPMRPGTDSLNVAAAAAVAIWELAGRALSD